MTWGSTWEGKRIVFLTDNLPITQIWQAGSSRSPSVMFLIRKLFLTAARDGYSISLKHIPGVYNNIADAISRFQVGKLKQLLPDVDPSPTELPITTMELLQDIHNIPYSN